MSMASRPSESRAREWSALERDICQQLPARLSRSPDRNRLGGDYWDAIASEPLVDEPPLRLIGTQLVGEGSLVELKTCQQWTTDRSCGGGRRRGRWTFHEGNHQQRLANDVAHALVVLDDREVVNAAIVTADVLEDVLAGRWHGSGRERGRTAHLGWPRVFSKLDGEVVLRE